MFVTYGVRRSALAVVAVVGVVFMTSAPTFAQEPPKDPNPGAITVTGSLDFLNQYMFRGIRQNSTGIAIWPAVDLGIAAYSGEGGLKSVGINFGTWNSLHTGDTGQDGPSGKLWYESDFYATLGFRIRRRRVVLDDLHGVHEPEQRLHDGEGDHVQAGRGRQRQAGQGRGEALHRDRARVRYRHRDGVRPTAARTRARIWSSVSPRATRRPKRASRFRSRWA